MKIAIITSTFPPYKGGMGRVALSDAEQLSELGHEVTVLTPQRGAEESAVGKSYRTKRLPVWLRISNFTNGMFVPTAALALGRYDLVILHYPFYGAAEPVWLARCCGRRGKLLVYYHMDALGTGWLKPFIAAHSRFAMPRIVGSADRVLVTTMDYAENGNLARLIETRHGLFRELALAVDVDTFVPGPFNADLAKRLGRTDSDKVILFVAGLDRAHYFKGLSNLLLAMTAPELQRAKLIVVGGGELKDDYELEAERLGLRGRAVFTGKVSDEELPDYYRLADVMAFPSVDKSEAFGIAALEAMSSGVPVVASDLAGVRTIVRDGETGLRIPVGSASALVLALSRLLSEDGLRRDMGSRARQMAVSEYSDYARIQRWGAILEEMFPDWQHFSRRQK